MDQIKKAPHYLIVFLVYALALALVSSMVIGLELRDSLLYLFIVPCILCAFFYGRRVYLPMIVSLTVVAIWVTFRVSGNFQASLTSIVIGTLGNIVMTETIRCLVTSRERAEAALRESEEQLRLIIENIPVLMDAFDANGNILVWNQECERVTGFSAAEIVGNPRAIQLLYPDEDYRTFIIEQLAKYGSNFRNLEWDIGCKDGSKKTILWSNMSEQFPVPGWYSWAVGLDITERKQAKERIQQQNEFLNNIIESLADPFYVIDAQDYTIQIANSAARNLGPAEATTCYALTHHRNTPCDGLEHPCPLATIQKIKEPVVVEHIHFDQAGNPIYMEIHGYPIFNNKGDVVQLIEYSSDITERKRAEEELRKNEEKYRLLTERMKDVVILLSPTGELLYVSPTVKEFGGYDPESEIGSDMSKYFENEIDAICAAELLTKVLETRQSGNFEFLFKAKDRKPFPVEHTYFPIVSRSQ